jgi:hypothetical protein
VSINTITGGYKMAEISQIRAILFREGDLWVAQCLEYDIGVQAPDLAQLSERLHIAIGAERKESIARNGTAFSGIDPAPHRFFEMWDHRGGEYRPADREPENGSTHVQLALCA